MFFIVVNFCLKDICLSISHFGFNDAAFIPFAVPCIATVLSIVKKKLCYMESVIGQ
jgi:hypothetical protein